MTSLFCACFIYIQGGLLYDIPRSSPESAGYVRWDYDRNKYENPVGQFQMGYEIPVSKVKADLFYRHESFPRVGDRGSDAIGLTLRIYF